MDNYDPNKRHRDQQRRYLQKYGWVAVEAVKPNGAFKNAWIHPKRKGSYSREDAISVTKRNANQDFYHVDDKFFAKLNEVNTYWAGFLAADGSISNNTVSIDLKPSDKKHLDKLAKVISYFGERAKDNQRHTRLQFTSPRIVKDLKANFGITPRKSMTIGAPSLTNENHIRAFIRGFMDGDGSIYQRNDGYWCVSFNGTQRMLTWIKREIRRSAGCETIIGNPSVVHNGNIFKLTFVGEQALDIMLWLYDRSHTLTRLTRKYKLTDQAGVCV